MKRLGVPCQTKRRESVAPSDRVPENESKDAAEQETVLYLAQRPMASKFRQYQQWKRERMVAIGAKNVGVDSEIRIVHFEISYSSYTLSKLMIVSVRAPGICCRRLDQDKTAANGGIWVASTKRFQSRYRTMFSQFLHSAPAYTHDHSPNIEEFARNSMHAHQPSEPTPRPRRGMEACSSTCV